MSIGSISGSTNWWQNQVAQASASSNAGTTSAASPTSDSITNTGTVAASNVSSFMQSFSADLQAMLTQLGDEANTSATSATSATSPAASTSTATGTSTAAGSTTASATNPTDPTQSEGEVHHHHHHHGGGEGGSMDNTANQLVGQIGQSLQGGTLGSGQISQSASVFAGDVMQALQSYGSTAAGASLPPILA
jgi:hypothetical protein